MNVEEARKSYCIQLLSAGMNRLKKKKKRVNLILISSKLGLSSKSYLAKPLLISVPFKCASGLQYGFNHSDLYEPDLGQ